MTDFPGKICEHPVFIIGAPRSGTSILAMSLAHHAELWCSHESDLLFNLLANKHAERAFKAAVSRPEGTWIGKEQVSPSEYLGYLGMGLNALYTSRSGAKRWIDQTPVNTMIAETLAEMFPGAHFLHALRDSRRVVHSMIHFADSLSPDLRDGFTTARMLPDWATGFRQACRTWRLFVESAMTFSERYADRCFTVVNEDLSARPQEHFTAIFQFLGVSVKAGPANFFRSSRLNSSFAPNVWGSATEQGQSAAMASVTDSKPWTRWPSEDRATFLEEILPVLSKYKLLGEDELTHVLD